MIFEHSAAVAVIACLISESELAAPIREFLKWRVLYCPICLGIWLALPLFWYGWGHYFLTVALSNLWMLVILKVYESLDAVGSDDVSSSD